MTQGPEKLHRVAVGAILERSISDLQKPALIVWPSCKDSIMCRGAVKEAVLLRLSGDDQDG
jgi:hypothetical protein